MADINIKDVANRAGVSAMTVTRTIKNPDLVREQTRLKVKQAIRELGYIPNRTASTLRLSKSSTIGITLFDIENPFMSKLIMQMEKNLKKHNYSILINVANESEADDYDIYAFFKSFNVDLFIFIPTNHSSAVSNLSPEASSRCLQLFRESYNGIDSFVVDDIYGAYLATKHLLENGHERILLIDFQQPLPMYRDRGYYQAFREKGINYYNEMVLKLPEFDSTSYLEQITSAIKEKKPTAIIAVTQKLFEASITAIRELGLRIYDDISIIGYDDTVLARHLGITTISHPFDEMIDKISDWAIRKISGKDDAEVKRIKILPYLNIRSSVRPLKE